MEERLIKKFMKIALREGEKGLGRVSPNPPVGAVIVEPKNFEIIAKGYHAFYGGPHAERVAISRAGEKVKGAYLFVTLEPCNHYGKTPPCSKAIIEAGIKKVFISVRDPNPVAKGGIETLKKARIEVQTGILTEEGVYLARFFLSRIFRKRPWVISKVASSLDGKIATSSGDSKWITCEKARKMGHKLRAICDAILVGKNTVLKDNPELTCRMVKGKNPVRIVLDTRLTLSPEKFKIFNTLDKGRVVVVCGRGVSERKKEIFLKKGIDVWEVEREGERISIKAFLERACEEGINSLLVEGGGEIQGSFFSQRLVDEGFYFIGPIIIGDKKGKPAIAGPELESLSSAAKLKDIKVKKIGESFLFHFFTEEGKRSLKEWEKELC